MRNQVFLIFDSLRWDVFKKAKTPFLKSLGKWRKAYTQATYTFPAIMSFFVGKLPQVFNNRDFFDTVATRFNFRGEGYRNLPLWNLSNPESQRKSRLSLNGKNIIFGFNEWGYNTIGTGGVNWFNPTLPAGKYLTESFKEFKFFDGPDFAFQTSAEDQVDWVINRVKKSKEPYFVFINFGETHHKYIFRNCEWFDAPNPYGNPSECKIRQQKCIEYLDKIVEILLNSFSKFDLVICSDHGDAMGENGLWGHGFFHKKVIEVPILIKLD